MIEPHTLVMSHVAVFRETFARPRQSATFWDLYSQLKRYENDLAPQISNSPQIADQRRRLADLSFFINKARLEPDTAGQIFLGSQRALQLSGLFPFDEEKDDAFLARYERLISGHVASSESPESKDPRFVNPSNSIGIVPGRTRKILTMTCRVRDEDRLCAMKCFPNFKNYLGVALNGFFSELAFQGIPNVFGAVEVFDFGVNHHEGTPYLLMKFMRNGNLVDYAENYCEELETFSLKTLLAGAVAIVGCLAATHSRGIVHRDIKPENILFTAEGECRLADFGMASTPAELEGFPQRAHFCGTPGFLPPEAFVKGYEQSESFPPPEGWNEKFRAGFTTDVYAMGVTLLWFFTGHGDQKPEQLNSLIKKFRANPDDDRFWKLPKPLRPILQKALSEEPAQRYQKGIKMMRAVVREAARVQPSANG